jgi:DNA-binding NarL/FixJ family response regulator
VISVALVDDQPLIRAGLRMVVESQPDLRLAAEGGDGDEAIALTRAHRPDVLLLDVRMPGTDGIRALPAVLSASPETRVIMLTTFDLDEYVYAALRAGASAFLLKDAGPESIISAIRQVVDGGILLAPAITRRLVEEHISRRPRGDVSALSVLTDRERDVLAVLAQGLSNAEIGQRLHVSEGTVKTHVSRILAKLGLRDRVQAVIAAYELGLVAPGG